MEHNKGLLFQRWSWIWSWKTIGENNKDVVPKQELG